MPSDFKKYLSYIYEFPVEKMQSQLSGEVAVSYHKGQYKLSTNNAIYSFGKYYTSFSKAFDAMDIQRRKIDSVLVLGFGLGSVVNLLEKHPTIKKITAVDIDDIIITLAKKYLEPNLKNKIEFITSDASEFLSHLSKKYDLVLFDVFIQDLTPEQFLKEELLINLKKSVQQNGILFYSKISSSFQNKIENAQFGEVFSSVFPEAFTIDTDGNRVFSWVNSSVNA